MHHEGGGGVGRQTTLLYYTLHSYGCIEDMYFIIIVLNAITSRYQQHAGHPNKDEYYLFSISTFIPKEKIQKFHY